jgi:hypothetical protein
VFTAITFYCPEGWSKACRKSRLHAAARYAAAILAFIFNFIFVSSIYPADLAAQAA